MAPALIKCSSPSLHLAQKSLALALRSATRNVRDQIVFGLDQ